MLNIKNWSTALVVVAFSLPVAAQSADDTPIEEIVIYAHPLSGEGLAQATHVLEGDALARDAGASIGQTVSKLPGVQSASFGPAVGRPVIRGLGGPRVRVLEDRIDTLDASVSSGDHATTIEPFIADRVEILKGASTLLYGSGAIGGVVDVHTGRIPHGPVEGGVTGRASLRSQSNGDGQTGAARVDGSTGSIAWHLDGVARDFDGYDGPGFVQSKALRMSEGTADEDAQRGRVPGTQFNGKGGAAGLSWVGSKGFVGAAVSVYNANYGLPGAGEEPEPGEEAGNSTLDMEQTRVDFEAGVDDPFAFLDSINLRLAINDYEHQEIEPSGEAGTTFSNDAFEARAEFVHTPLAGWHGAFGIQGAGREFSVVGEEAFVPEVDTDSVGVFWVVERQINDTQVEAGARVERVSHSPAVGRGRDFDLYAGSLGVIHDFSDALTLTALLDVSSRAPVSEELYSNGPHLATQTFDVGDNDLGREGAVNTAITLDYDDGRWGLQATLYNTSFNDFIYQIVSNELEDGLSIAPYVQEDANFTGLDLGAHVNLGDWSGASWQVTGLFDIVRARVSGDGSDFLPRISPTRIGLGLKADWNRLSAGLNLVARGQSQ